jgi:cyclase
LPQWRRRALLRPRLIGVVVVRQGLAVQSIGFCRYLPIGRPEIVIEYLDRWGIDEIAVLDISAGRENRCISVKDVQSWSQRCQVPLTVGGGVRKLEEFEALIRAGADKVALNTWAVAQPDLIGDAAAAFGVQAVVVSIDAQRLALGRWEVKTDSGSRTTGLDPAVWAQRAAGLGAGEILLTSIDGDGSKTGYDIALIAAVARQVDIPVIACGGAGHPRHLHEGVTAGASAVAVANALNYTEHSVIAWKAWLQEHGTAFRADTYARYDARGFDERGRASTVPETALERLRFEYIPEERI